MIKIRIARTGLHIRELPSFERERIHGQSNPRTFRDCGRLVRLSGARKTGVTAAQGEIVAFLDDDAITDETWLEELTPVYDDPVLRAGAIIGGSLVTAAGYLRGRLTNGTMKSAPRKAAS